MGHWSDSRRLLFVCGCGAGIDVVEGVLVFFPIEVPTTVFRSCRYCPQSFDESCNVAGFERGVFTSTETGLMLRTVYEARLT